MPEWAQRTDVAELAIAQLLGTWDENSQADKAIAEQVSGNVYGEWIGKMREITLRPGTPLMQRDGIWKIVSRYEGWYALGPRLFDDHLDRMKDAAISVLRERDPKFELPPEERYAASIHGKVMKHSHALRKGLAESLALVGSHPKALTSCSFAKVEATAVLAVRAILAEADWVQWASLNNLLPLLAEAAPRAFLDAVEHALQSHPCPFDTVFAQEGAGITGSNYMTGLLWALETLAWDAASLTRVVVILGELAARDPGGNWANRPANSLTGILLPWFPQTCAPIPKRQASVETLSKECPDVAWKLLLSLLPNAQQISSGSRKPAWREMIADNWSNSVTRREYWDQIAGYADLAIRAAKNDLAKLSDLIERVHDLPPLERQQLLAHLGSDAIVSLPQADRLRLWTELVDQVSRHKKFADAEWAMEPGAVSEIAAIAKRLAPDAPHYRHQRLFSERDFDLYEAMGNYEKQQRELDERRQRAVADVLAAGGVEGILEFTKAVESPWRVGVAFGAIAVHGVDREVLPVLLESETSALVQFAGGFVWSRFRGQGWPWVDQIDSLQWAPSQQGQFFAYLPFTPDTWERVARLLGEDEFPYWSKTSANPYEAKTGLGFAIDRLVAYGRAHAAIQCLEKMCYDKQPLDSQRAVRVLQAVLHASEGTHAMDEHAIVEVIKALQDNPNTNPDDLFHIEWAFLPLLDRHHGASPKLMERRLANDPAFFCEIIRMVFRSTKEEKQPVEELTEQQQHIVTNAYRLLSRWGMPPGSQTDGTYDGDALTAWLEEVKAACTESGHVDIALSRVGQVLIHTPPDPDGLWLHHAAATALNARDVGAMRQGFTTALLNARGAHWVDPEGRAEREFAMKYRDQAEKLESHGYHRLADALRELAVSYDRDAERLASSDLFDV